MSDGRSRGTGGGRSSSRATPEGGGLASSRGTRTYLLLVAILAVLGAASVFLPGAPAGLPAPRELPASRPVMALVSLLALGGVYGGLGWIGLRASRTVGFPGIWAPGVSGLQRFGIPAAAGGALGAAFIVVDLALAPINGLGLLPHPPFPTSLLASATAAIGEEILFRLLLVGGGFWLLDRVVTTARAREGAFWAVALFSAVAFTAAHLPGILFILGGGDPASATLPPMLLAQLLLLNGALSLVAAELLRRGGLLAAIGLHFWVDIVWHVIYGALQ